MSRGLLLFNPAAGGGRDRAALAVSVAALLSTDLASVEPVPTQRPGHATEIVRRLFEEAGDAEPGDVIVLGGDGTLNEAVWGAHQAGRLREGGPGPRFGIVPAGTANVIARDLGLPRNTLQAAAALASGAERAFDVGLCRSSEGERPFLLAAGIGIEAETIAAVDPELKRRIGPAAFLRAAWSVAGKRDRALEVRARLADGSELERRVAGSITCGNSRLYGGPCRLSRLAAFDDGRLELLLMGSTSLRSLLGLGLASRFWDASRAPGAEVLSIVEAEVGSPRPCRVHVDAEPFGRTPASFSVLRRALRLRAPA